MNEKESFPGFLGTIRESQPVYGGLVDLAIEVLTKRANVCREVIKQRIQNHQHYDVSFFAGKREGYEQAIDVLKSSIEELRIEL